MTGDVKVSKGPLSGVNPFQKHSYKKHYNSF